MATSRDINTCGDALGCVGDFFSQEKTKDIMSRFSRALEVIENMPGLSTDKDIKTQQVYIAACDVRDAVSTTFVHARAYIDKCYGLADFICDEKEYTIEAIQEGKAEDFKDFLEEVLDKSQCCQKDILQLKEYIDKTEEPKVKEEERKVVDIQKAASNQEMFGNIMVNTGIFGTLAGGIGALGTCVLGIGSVGLLQFVITGAAGAATAVGVGSAQLGVASVAACACLANPAVAVVGVPVGLAVAVTSFVLLAKGSVLTRDSKELIAYCERALGTIRELHSFLDKINHNLVKVNEQLKISIDGNLEDIVSDDSKLEKIRMKKGQVQRSMIKKINTVIEQCEHLREYCGPLRDVPTLKDFMEKTKSQ